MIKVEFNKPPRLRQLCFIANINSVVGRLGSETVRRYAHCRYAYPAGGEFVCELSRETPGFIENDIPLEDSIYIGWKEYPANWTEDVLKSTNTVLLLSDGDSYQALVDYLKEISGNKFNNGGDGKLVEELRALVR